MSPLPRTISEHEIIFPDGTKAKWGDLKVLYQECGRREVCILSEAVLDVIPASERQALVAWASVQRAIVDVAGVFDVHDHVFLALLQATRNGHGQHPQDIVDKILARNPPSAIGILLPALAS